MGFLNPLSYIKDFMNILHEFDGQKAPFQDPYGQNKRRKPKPYQPQQVFPPQWRQLTVEEQWPGRWFHGTPTIQNALDIMKTHHWYVKADHGNPIGIYVGKEFNLAQSYIGNQGAVVVVYIHPRILVEQLGTTNHYYVPVPEKHSYYVVQGMEPVACLDKSGNRIL